MAANVQQLSPAELAQLRQQALALARDMSSWLSQHPAADDYFVRSKKLHELIAQLDLWEKQGIDILTDDNLAGSAIAGIAEATAAMQQATQRVAAVGADIRAFAGFVELMTAISSGKPAAIIKQGRALCDAARAAQAAEAPPG